MNHSLGHLSPTDGHWLRSVPVLLWQKLQVQTPQWPWLEAECSGTSRIGPVWEGEGDTAPVLSSVPRLLGKWQCWLFPGPWMPRNHSCLHSCQSHANFNSPEQGYALVPVGSSPWAAAAQVSADKPEPQSALPASGCVKSCWEAEGGNTARPEGEEQQQSPEAFPGMLAGVSRSGKTKFSPRQSASPDDSFTRSMLQLPEEACFSEGSWKALLVWVVGGEHPRQYRAWDAVLCPGHLLMGAPLASLQYSSSPVLKPDLDSWLRNLGQPG
jgi:hypothetical protein